MGGGKAKVDTEIEEIEEAYDKIRDKFKSE
jgi:hypothetical protein